MYSISHLNVSLHVTIGAASNMFLKRCLEIPEASIFFTFLPLDMLGHLVLDKQSDRRDDSIMVNRIQTIPLFSSFQILIRIFKMNLHAFSWRFLD